MRAVRRTLITVAMTVGAIVAAAAPAAAHGVAGVGATNFQTRLKQVKPEVPGIEMRVIEVGSRFELTNTTAEDVVVFGYQEEPYLRIGPAGVFENRRSPATYLNADRQGTTAVPGSADPEAPPQWKQVSDARIARWHDHRIHWMGNQDPPTVRRAPDRRHVVIPDWKIAMRVGDRTIEASGDLVWVPGPSPVPWLVLALALLVLVAALSCTGAWAWALALVLTLLVAADIVHAGGSAFARAGPIGTKLGDLAVASLVSVFAWAAAVVAVLLLLRRRPEGLFVAAFAGIFIALVGGLADLADLTRSQVPFAWGAGLARFLVSVSLGVGLGLLAAAVLGVRRHPVRWEEPATALPDTPSGATMRPSRAR